MNSSLDPIAFAMRHPVSVMGDEALDRAGGQPENRGHGS